jgi:hypothetical protein
VVLTMSSPYLTHYDSVSIRNTFLNYAKITISSSEGEEEILTLYRENRFFPPFVYKSVSVRGQTGVEYQLTVVVGGKTLSATTSIPRPPVFVEFGLYYVNAEQRFYNEYGRYEYDLRDTVDVIAGTVDSVSYRVLSTLFRDRASQENPFAFNGNRIESNIEGGIGRWTGIGISGVTTVTSDY